MTAQAVNLVCSNRPRAATKTSGMGNQWWARETFHIASDSNKTLCGRDCSEWLTIGPRPVNEALGDRNCCARCAAKVTSRVRGASAA